MYSYSMPAVAVHWAMPATAAADGGRHARAEADRRWPMIVRKLAALRRRQRLSVRIVDANCGDGALLIEAARHARALGFVAIEARGVDSDAQRIARARRAAAAADDPAIGLEFEVGDPREVLREEAEFPADLLFYEGQERRPDVLAAMARAAGRTVLRAPVAGDVRHAA